MKQTLLVVLSLAYLTVFTGCVPPPPHDHYDDGYHHTTVNVTRNYNRQVHRERHVERHPVHNVPRAKPHHNDRHVRHNP
ncbi:MAG: hypothetical protein IJU65_03270 [Desulfovibrio sp.]|nr:hypothetical protein [Desulfovibrio sp.]